MAQIKHVVFDLGKVLVDFSYSQLFPLLRRRGALISDVEDFASKVRLIDYEHGRISTDEFLRGINALLSAPLDAFELKNAWCAIFTPLPQMLNMARRLRAQVGVYIISNTGEIHWDYLRERFSLNDLCKDAFASCEVGHMKPVAAIYAAAETRFNFAPEEAVFIDDRKENVAGAKACGWQAIHHQSYGQTRDALINLGLDLPAG
jgi:putative hydrolase of the HAD superfamily